MSIVDEKVDESENENVSTSDCSLSSCSKASKTELIQRILDSLKVIPPTHIYLTFTAKNRLGLSPHLDNLFDEIVSRTNQSCQNINMDFENMNLNETLSIKDKESILRVLLRREQIAEHFLNQSTSK